MHMCLNAFTYFLKLTELFKIKLIKSKSKINLVEVRNNELIKKRNDIFKIKKQ